MISILAKQLLEDITTHFPPSSNGHLTDSSQLKALIESALQKMNVVSREEFDTQAAILARTQQQLVALQEQLVELEKMAVKQPS